MNESKRRGTLEQRKAEAILTGRKSGALGALQRKVTFLKKIGKDANFDVSMSNESNSKKAS